MSYQRSLFSQQFNGLSAKNVAGIYQKDGRIEPIDTAEQILKWQQKQYLIDSGINSGVTSEVASTCSKIDNDEVDDSTQPFEEIAMPQNYGQQQQTNRQDEFYCTKPVDAHYTPYSNAMNESTHPNRLINGTRNQMTPSEILGNAVCNLINCQDERYLREIAIPELDYLLNLDDQVVASKAAFLISLFSANAEMALHAIISSPQLVASIIRKIHTSNGRFAMPMMSTIFRLSQVSSGLHVIYRLGVVPVLLESLRADEPLKFRAITTLHNLLATIEESKVTIRSMEGVKQLTALLQNNNEKFLAITIDCIAMLAQGNPESKMAILANNGTQRLVEVMKTFTYVKLLWITARTLKMLSCCSENKKAIIESGGMHVLAYHLNTPCLPLLDNCLLTMRNISDIASRHITGQNVNFILDTLLHFVSGENSNIVACSAGTLRNLTCNNEANKSFIYNVGGIEVLIGALDRFGNREEVVEPVLCALRNLTNGHPRASAAQEAIGAYNGIPIVVRLLQPPNRWPIMKEAIWLVRNLSQTQSNWNVLRECGVIGRLVEIFMRAYHDVQRQARACVDGVKMEDVLFSTVAALLALSMDIHNRVFIKNSGIETYLVQLLHINRKGMQNEASALLNNLRIETERTRKKQQNAIQNNPGSCSENSMHQATNAFAPKKNMHALNSERLQGVQMPTKTDAHSATCYPTLSWTECDHEEISDLESGFHDNYYDNLHTATSGTDWLNY